MIVEILLTSETTVKSICPISENLAMNYLRPAIREAQEVNLRNIIGECLLTKLKDLVNEETINEDENAAYKALVDRSQYFLAFTATAILTQMVTYKVTNAGVVKTPDERVEVASQPDMAKTTFFYQSKADSEALDIQNWLLENRTAFPELTDCECNKIQAHLRDSASCGIWLGGARGRKIRRY